MKNPLRILLEISIFFSLSFESIGQATVCTRISSSLDDVEEEDDGTMYTNSSDLELVADGGRGNQIIGLRYTSLLIPQGTTISNAYLQFTTDETNSGASNLSIKGEYIDNSPAFTTATNNLSDRGLRLLPISVGLHLIGLLLEKVEQINKPLIYKRSFRKCN
tara:strand:- start:432 stop:917 length:486 start_codon:yes stop_codon:yes gene_type:complete